jgi:hypothetical protein
MSRAVASAKQRRAGVSAPEPPAFSAPAPPANGLTLPQVIALVDTRLIKLEKFMKDTLETGVSGPVPLERSVSFAQDTSSGATYNEETSIGEVLQEYDNRFMLLAEEIAQMKDTLMKLQTYTMDVNKMLLEERVNVLSDLGNDKTMFVMEDATLAGGDVEGVDK